MILLPIDRQRALAHASCMHPHGMERVARSPCVPVTLAVAAAALSGCGLSQVCEARTWHDRGQQLLRVGQLERGVASLERAERLLAAAPGHAVGRARSLRAVNGLALGNVYRRRGELRRALAVQRTALDIARQLHQPLLHGVLSHNLASLELRLGLVRRAAARWKSARDVAAASGDRRLLARIENGLGSCELEQQRPVAARRHFRAARTLAAEAGAVRHELLAQLGLARAAELAGTREHAGQLLAAVIERAHTLRLQGVALTARINAAAAAVRSGELQRALALLDRARDDLRRVDGATERAFLLHNLGAVYLLAGMPADALVYYERAARAVPDPRLTVSVAAALFASGRLDRAGELVAHALRGEDEPELRRRASWLAAWIAHRQGQPDRATGALAQACATPAAGRLASPDEADCLFARGAFALERDRAGAAVLAQQALDRFGRRGDARGVLRARLLLAAAQEAAGHGAAALRSYARAADGVERLWPTLGSDRLKTGYLESKAGLYTRALALLAQRLPRSQPTEASSASAELIAQLLGFVERSRGRGLLDLLQQSQAPGLRQADPRLRRRYEQQLRSVQRLQAHLATSTEDDPRRLRALEDAVRRLDAVRLRLVRSLPGGATIAPPLVGLAALRRAASSDGAALVSYYLDREVGLALTIAPEGYRVRRLPAPARIEQRATMLVELIRGRQDDPVVRQAFAELAAGLYRDLLAPEAELLRGRTLVVSAHGALLQLPFQALLTSQPEPPTDAADFYARLPYLIHRSAVLYVPSLAVWHALREARAAGRQDAIDQAWRHVRFLGLGDPRWPRQRPPASSAPVREPVPRGPLRSIRQLLRGDPLPPLPHARREVADIAAGFGAGQRHALIGRYARESALKRLLAAGSDAAPGAVATRPRYLHLAAHGLVQDEQPQLSSIVLAPGDGDDGLLELLEIYGLPLRGVELTVLSACETARGQTAAEGVIGLVRGFLGAGSAAVVASLWNVSDESTRLLMTALYRALRSGASSGEALRASARELARGAHGAHLAHPFYWAPFGVYGADRHGERE